jgi:hypothetical protein
MNPIVESVLYTQGSFWGDPDKFRFRTKVDNFTNTTDLLQDQDRVIRTSFTITMYGYIVPDVLAKNLSKKQSSKVIDTRQLVIDTLVDNDPTVFQQQDQLATGAGVSVSTPIPTTAPNPNALTSGNPLLLAYLNTNISKEATSISLPGTATFNASFLAAPAGLPATSIANFIFFVNGQYVEPSAVTSFVDNGDGSCTVVFDVGQLGFNLVTSDEVVAIGKFA